MEFTNEPGVCFALLLLWPLGAAAQRIALSFDDGLDPKAQPNAANLNAFMLRGLEKNKVRGIFFVAGSRVDSEEGLALVHAWSNAGHLAFGILQRTGFIRKPSSMPSVSRAL